MVYAPHPFRKHAAVRGRSNGLGQVSEGLEVALEDLPPWEEDDVLTYPMLWTNPMTGEKALQGELLSLIAELSSTCAIFTLRMLRCLTIALLTHIITLVHSIAAWKLLVKRSPDAEEQVVDDIEEVRRIIYALQRPALEPKYIFAPPYNEGDLVIFYNRGLMHCATGEKLSFDGRVKAVAPQSLWLTFGLSQSTLWRRTVLVQCIKRSELQSARVFEH